MDRHTVSPSLLVASNAFVIRSSILWTLFRRNVCRCCIAFTVESAQHYFCCLSNHPGAFSTIVVHRPIVCTHRCATLLDEFFHFSLSSRRASLYFFRGLEIEVRFI